MSLTHLDARGQARMVDVSGKPETARRALAEGVVTMSPETRALALVGTAKGDVLGTARLAGIMGAKRTADLVPLCHPLPLDAVTVDIAPTEEPHGLRVEVAARTTGRTGVEMEALTAASVACLTLYDMLKAAQKDMTVTGLRVLEKDGGTSGPYRA